ncbi:antibiotic resistance protein MarC [Thioclava sp. L04-15]|uniref:MarC family protein n=1 Tax=Thioclava sp. L04-15 TaxID=1915318 RepID=UPI00099744AB|nr:MULTISPECIES: MarC family protein [unclassified Thioclava]MBD3804667.1 MarC family protein [Thioclava sp.]OOY27456.1 antibiotic resistance protein MarC [Thioclava sp. L04-15]TNE86618.1 MAG: MarC family protein [Paracoccaceae bacterium]
METALFIKAFGALFAIMNPFVNLPVFLGLTDGMERAAQRRTALQVTLYSAGLSAVIVAAGTPILKLFGISVDDFRVAGGLVLLTIALGMLNGSGSPAHSGTPAEQAHQAQREDIAFYPLAFPMLVGPGTITTLIVFSGRAQDGAGYIALITALVLVLAMVALVMWFAADIGHHMSQTLRTITTRLMGMILAAIAIEMIATGLRTLLPGLG